MPHRRHATTATPHPYYPQDIDLPGFVPGSWTAFEIIGLFGVLSAIVVVAAWLFSGRVRHLSISDRWIFCWWAFTGMIHTVVEGGFVLMPKFFEHTSRDLLTEIWKEYSKGDSRYATRDAFVVGMETVTAFVEGPLCFVILYAMTKDKPYRYPLQLLVCLGQLYGDILYYCTCYLEGFIHAAPGILYFWFYFVVMNAIWIVVPGLVAWRAYSRICAVFAKAPVAKRAKQT